MIWKTIVEVKTRETKRRTKDKIKYNDKVKADQTRRRKKDYKNRK